ncbi:Glycosyltransferase involved in cell wall bisynthesis [Flavobacterium sp. CF108]|uniref:glycosyltransferase family 2 protein n=1 Tax=unclassified Flavobacterium TaxID=196869 RepID=UPI0008B46C69|nr:MULTISPECIES: glycosyltransferase [unclassified Flavobacterium]SEO86999.1 Glycosyltransferase involved in cell wall bisynthesis [Flavobacterium sp. fv08]SHG68336.1 Glycosyltransferase involved in cell wall bisynthesis [Flavobacterium sp. CF108]
MRDQNDIISSWKNSDTQPLVSIICTTFNHESFIGETLNGFLIQKTTFPFEIIVHDDASTDNTASVINDFASKYSLIIKPILQKENQYSKKEVNIWSDFTFPKAQGKYIALCEGDDYWIDELKLQKQVDFLENNSEYVITWTDFYTKKEAELIPNDFNSTLPVVYTIDFNTLFKPYCTYTLTSVFKKDAVDPLDYKKFQYSKDNTLYALALCNGKGAFLNFQGAVYRWHSGGIYSLQTPFLQRYSSYLNLKEIFDNIPQSRTQNIKRVLGTLLKASAFEALKLRKNKEFKNGKDHQNAINEFLDKASLSLKMKYLWRYIKTNI